MDVIGRQGRRIVALAGGVGAARFLRGLLATLRDEPEQPTAVTVIGNTGDDITLFGLRVCPDLDTVMYTLGGGIEESQGWGRADETFTVKDELATYGAQPQWFGLGDRDIATHVLRTQWLAEGMPLSEITRRLCERWDLGVRLLPMSDDVVETHVFIEDSSNPDGERSVHFQEWWVRLHAAIPARRIVAVDADAARPAPGVLDAIAAADIILLPPSNPVVSIGTILQVPGIREAIVAAEAPVVGVSPIIGGAPVRGMADACLSAIGVATSARAVAEHYGSDLLDGWLVDDADRGLFPDVDGTLSIGGLSIAGLSTDGLSTDGLSIGGSSAGHITVLARPLLMSDIEATAAIARGALELAADLVT